MLSVEISVNSATSSQPEIVTIPERIVTISTRSSLSSDRSLSDSGQILTVQEKLVTISAAQHMEDDSTTSQAEEEEEKIPPRLPDKFHQYAKVSPQVRNVYFYSFTGKTAVIKYIIWIFYSSEKF